MVPPLPPATEALQRLADSLQVLVLLLPSIEFDSDSRHLLVSAAAKQALEDVAALRDCLLGARDSRDPFAEG